MAKVNKIQPCVTDRIVVLSKILKSLMENVEAKNEIFRDIVEMLEMH